MGKTKVEMVTTLKMLIDEYSVNNLEFFSFEINDHSTILIEFEPLIERININVLMYQVTSFI